MQQLIVIGGGIMQVPVLRIARTLGVSTLCLDGDPEAPGRREADAFLVADIKDKDLCLAAAREHGRKFGVDGVITVGTDFSTTSAWISESLGLPGHPYQAALRAKDKELMRKALAEAGLPSPRFQILDKSQFGPADRVGFPCVVKPVDSMGARGVRLVENLDDFSLAVLEAQAFSSSGRAIVEEYVEGPEYSLDALIQRDNFFAMGLADRDIHFSPRFVELGHTFPSLASGERSKALWELLKESARCLGLVEGACKGDLKWSQGGPVVGEIAARLSGGFMSGWTYPLHAGRSSIEGAIRIALGQTIAPDPENRSDAVAERAFFSIPGRLRNLRGESSAAKVEGVKELFWNVRPGNDVIWPRNNVEKLGTVIVSSSEPAKADATAKSVRLTIEVDLECPNSTTDAFFADLESAWWFPEAKAAGVSASSSFLQEKWENWKDDYGIRASEWKETLASLWPRNPSARFWLWFFKGGPSGVRYGLERFGDRF